MLYHLSIENIDAYIKKHTIITTQTSKPLQATTTSHQSSRDKKISPTKESPAEILQPKANNTIAVSTNAVSSNAEGKNRENEISKTSVNMTAKPSGSKQKLSRGLVKQLSALQEKINLLDPNEPFKLKKLANEIYQDLEILVRKNSTLKKDLHHLFSIMKILKQKGNQAFKANFVQEYICEKFHAKGETDCKKPLEKWILTIKEAAEASAQIMFLLYGAYWKLGLPTEECVSLSSGKGILVYDALPEEGGYYEQLRTFHPKAIRTELGEDLYKQVEESKRAFAGSKEFKKYQNNYHLAVAALKLSYGNLTQEHHRATVQEYLSSNGFPEPNASTLYQKLVCQEEFAGNADKVLAKMESFPPSQIRMEVEALKAFCSNS